MKSARVRYDFGFDLDHPNRLRRCSVSWSGIRVFLTVLAVLVLVGIAGKYAAAEWFKPDAFQAALDRP